MQSFGLLTITEPVINRIFICKLSMTPSTCVVTLTLAFCSVGWQLPESIVLRSSARPTRWTCWLFSSLTCLINNHSLTRLLILTDPLTNFSVKQRLNETLHAIGLSSGCFSSFQLRRIARTGILQTTKNKAAVRRTVWHNGVGPRVSEHETFEVDTNRRQTRLQTEHKTHF